MSGKVLDRLNDELAKLQQQRRDVVAQRSRLVADRDGVELPQDIDKAADVLMVLSAKIDAATRIIADLDVKIGAVTEQRDAAQLEANRIKAAALDGDCARIEADIMRAGEAMERLIADYGNNRRNRAAVLGEVNHPDNRFGHLSTQLQQLRINAALLASFSQK